MASKETVAEDTVEYCIFPVIPDKIENEHIVQFVQNELDSYLAYLSKYLVGYIWQNESLNLCVVPEKVGHFPCHLYGKICYGDNVEDEWFVTFILRELTKKFPGVVAKIWDFDGEVLLIEAAESLPKWLNPDTAENRVFIYQGKVHIIPVPKTPAQLTQYPTGTPTLQQGVECVRKYTKETTALLSIQRDIDKRLEKYPQKISEFFHHANCYVPASLAAVIEKDPSLVSTMVQAFYHRDPLELKSCITFATFRPGTRVMTRVKFTKCLYAQLMHQQFTPDRRSGFTIPPEKSPNFKSYDLGMKLAHGAEIACAKCSNTTSGKEVPVGTGADTRWRNFVESLSKHGYFMGELEGSRKYQQLLDDAKKFYAQSVVPDSRVDAEPGMKILQIANSVEYDIEELRLKGSKLPPSDDDEWLNLTPDKLDDMLKKMSGKTDDHSEFDPAALPKNMTDFVNKMSTHKGAEIPGDEIEFDPDSFMQTTQKLFDFDDDDYKSDSSLDEYDSDDDLSDSLSPSSPSKAKSAQSKPELLQMKDYMELMDRELAGTNIGKSFEKEATPEEPSPVAPPRRKKQTPTSQPGKKIPPPRPPPPTKKPQNLPTGAPGADDSDDDDDEEFDDDFKPVDVDLNLVKNLLESYEAQQGGAGPTSNLMASMGVKLPPPEQD